MTKENSYDFHLIEKKWQKKWEEKKVFEVKEDSKKKKFYVLDMFPYPSGAGLHMGHAFVFSLGDIYARFKRMQGFNVLYPIGYDALGLPAENAAIKAGTHPKDYTKKSIENFMRQQKAMGWSYDWTRLVNTSDPDFYKWDQWIFLQMLKKGIAYRKKAPVNWCNKCQSVLANEQVINGKCWRHDEENVEIKHLEQWFFKITEYAEELLEGLNQISWPDNAKKLQRNWIGKSHGARVDFEINGEKWPIFTTRPDTIYGVTFMVISAQHPRLFELVTKEQKSEVEKFLSKIKSVSIKSLKDNEDLDKEGVFTGSYAINPMTGDKVPVYAGNFVLADYAGGMVMAVPAHDGRDYEFAKKYKIPIKIVIEQEDSVIITIEESLNKDFYNKVSKIAKIVNENGLVKIYTNNVDEVFKIAEGNFIGGPWYIHSEGKVKKILFHTIKENKLFDWSSDKGCKESKDYGLKIKIKAVQLDFDKLREAYTGGGVLVNSSKFNGLDNNTAKEEIIKELEKKKLGKKTIQYKLRDWLISRQRYWGTPIPVVYCDKCGVVAVNEKDLPIKLPSDVKFGHGNPLLTNEKFMHTFCPKCKGKARRESDTMDTFVNSSWYYLRYCDSKNDKKIFDEKKVAYWAPIDQYIGGPEHITMHLIYARFYAKFLRDLGLIKFDEPAIKYFTQGIVHGSDGEKMSKSKGNVIEPLEMIGKYGADTLRLALVSFASPENDTSWDEKIVVGSHKFLNKVYEYFSSIKFGQTDKLIESKVNKAIKEISSDIENFKHNLAVIKIRLLFDYIYDKQIDKGSGEKILKMLHVYCPYITEELNEKIGGKGFISLASWPVCDEKKIDLNLEKQEEAFEKTISDINNIINIIKEKEGKEASKVFIYTIPPELKSYDSQKLSKKLGKEVKVFAVNDPKKYDPSGKAGKAKMGRPAVYIE